MEFDDHIYVLEHLAATLLKKIDETGEPEDVPLQLAATYAGVLSAYSNLLKTWKEETEDEE